MTSTELRQKFLKFFEKRGHKVIPSASLVPVNDPSVLFTTAGMQQFKRFYLFPNEAPAARIATCQKCVRTGDIDEVGDESHLTFFEMLGNFSFGYPEKQDSYFKEEAIKFAWEFLTNELEIEPSRISATYFDQAKAKTGITIMVDTDKESKDILEKIPGLSQITGQGDDNFWSLGTIESPGGPTVEFYVDGLEIWNLVFNDATFKGDHWHWDGVMKGVDTGMGFERLAAVLQKKSDVYKTDMFEQVINIIADHSGLTYEGNERPFRIIADHIRTSVMLIDAGIEPSNKDRGYVLRKLIRRAIIQAFDLNIKTEMFVARIADDIFKTFSSVYFSTHESNQDGFPTTHYDSKKVNILEIVLAEEKKFRKTFENGLKRFNEWADSIQETADLKEKIFPGDIAFDLWTTYGLPIESIREMAGEKGLKFDQQGFNVAFLKHQEKSRTASARMFKGGLADNKIETTRLHTAAHLLLAALKKILSQDVEQKGANITEERLRFDFNWPEKLTPEQISEIENMVNEKIKENLPVKMEEMGIDEAKKIAHGTFLDRYGDRVKVYTIGSGDQIFSREICGGPHVENTSELGRFKITKEESSSAGIRRIKAVLE